MFRSSVIRTVLPLLIAAGVVVFFGLPYFDRLLQSWFAADLQLRAHLVANSMEERLPELLARDDTQALVSSSTRSHSINACWRLCSAARTESCCSRRTMRLQP